MQSGNPYKLLIVRTIGPMPMQAAFSMETLLHKNNYKHLVRGEWFYDRVLA